jgi:predicted AlkP superfamily pyrophosphatase or phosphodiesterase
MPTPSPTLTVAAPESTAAATSPPLPTSLPASAEPLATSPCACDSACPCQINHVVIISVDGLRPDAIEQADTPILDGLLAQGAYSPAAQTVLPSVTLVNHASMLGGMSPEKHGIYWNSNDPDLGKIKGPTLFSAAHDAGLSTAMVVGKPKLEHLVLPGSVDHYIYAGFTDRQVTNEAITLIQTNMPALLFIHLPDVDSAGHALGWMSLAQLLAVSMTDSLIGEIVAALQEQDYLSQTLLIITSDHGGSGRRHGSDSPEDMTVPWLVVGPGVPAGMTLQSDIITYDTAATALYALRVPVPSEWDGRPVLEIFEQVPQ